MTFNAIGNRSKYCTLDCSRAAKAKKKRDSGYQQPYRYDRERVAKRNAERSVARIEFERVRRRANVRRVKEAVSAYKLERGCADCGYREHGAAIQFDHVTDGKKRNISSATTLRQFYAEVVLCEVVCANCHAVRTWARMRVAMSTR